MWAKLDRFLLDRWQTFATWFERTFDRSHFDVARFLIVVYVSGTAAHWMTMDTVGAKAVWGMLTLGALFVGVMQFWTLKQVERATRDGLYVNPEQASGVSRAIRGLQTGLVVFNAVSCVLVLRVGPIDVAFTALWAFYYVAACNVVPPWKKSESVDNAAWQAG